MSVLLVLVRCWWARPLTMNGSPPRSPRWRPGVARRAARYPSGVPP